MNTTYISKEHTHEIVNAVQFIGFHGPDGHSEWDKKPPWLNLLLGSIILFFEQRDKLTIHVPWSKDKEFLRMGEYLVIGDFIGNFKVMNSDTFHATYEPYVQTCVSYRIEKHNSQVPGYGSWVSIASGIASLAEARNIRIAAEQEPAPRGTTYVIVDELTGNVYDANMTTQITETNDDVNVAYVRSLDEECE